MKIGYFSSSTPITAVSPKRFQRAQEFLKAQGMQLTAGALTGQKDGYRSGSIQSRAAELNELIHNDTVNVIMATIGGSNTNAVLPYLDYQYLNQHPKTIVGYSDVTALLLAVQSQAPRCRVIYGPALVATFGEWPPLVDQAWHSFIKVLALSQSDSITLQAPSEWTDEAINWESFERNKKMRTNQWHFINQPVLSGRIMGGNLNTMYGIMGSRYFPKITQDDLLLLEDAEKDAATVEKNFAMLKNNGILDRVKGIVLGKHALFNDQGTHRRPIDILQEVLNDPTKPIIYDYDSCHTIPMLPTPLGQTVRIDARHMTLTIHS